MPSASGFLLVIITALSAKNALVKNLTMVILRISGYTQSAIEYVRLNDFQGQEPCFSAKGRGGIFEPRKVRL